MVWGDHLFNTEQIINEVQNIINNGENCLLEEKIIGRVYKDKIDNLIKNCELI